MVSRDELEKAFKEQLEKNQLIIKFGKKEHLEALQKGKLYMKNLRYYASLEEDGSGIPDNEEGLFVLDDIAFEMKKPGTSVTVLKGTAKKMKMDLYISQCPVFCMYSMDIRNLKNISICADRCEISGEFVFDAIQKEKLPKLGNYALIVLDTEVFKKKLKDCLNHEKHKYIMDYVKYYENNTLEAVNAVINGEDRIAFIKRKSKFEHQQEYRLYIKNCSVDDSLVLDIGDISEITKIVSTNELMDMQLIYKSQYCGKLK